MYFQESVSAKENPTQSSKGRTEDDNTGEELHCTCLQDGSSVGLHEIIFYSSCRRSVVGFYLWTDGQSLVSACRRSVGSSVSCEFPHIGGQFLLVSTKVWLIGRCFLPADGRHVGHSLVSELTLSEVDGWLLVGY